MSRISIDVTMEEHKRLKAMAALQGQSIKEFVLSRTLSDYAGSDEAEALKELEAMLSTRIERAKLEGNSSRTVEDIFKSTNEELAQ